MLINRLISIAPMLDWTDRHCRYFLRLLSKQVLLYTEMVTSNALLHAEPKRWLDYHVLEHPIALQLGGSVPKDLAKCAKLAVQYGYDEINLNVGCPSDRVQNGRFGACLMAQPHLVADCIAAMRDAVGIPVSVKTRIGIDEQDSYAELKEFIALVSQAGGCEIFIIHARKAWLQGLSPKQNREIPPLQYDRVYQLKQDFPHLHIGINGGITDNQQIKQHLEKVGSVMIGRAAYHNPYWLTSFAGDFYNDYAPLPKRAEIIENFIPYVEQQLKQGVRLQQMTRHILGLFQGVPGANRWRRYLSEHAHIANAGSEVIKRALAEVLACAG